MPPVDFTNNVAVLTSIGSQNVSDEDIFLATISTADSDSRLAVPEMLYGKDEWERRLAEDPDGSKAYAEFEFDWNFGLSPRERAEALWSNGLRDSGHALLRTVDEQTYANTKEIDAAHLARIRNRRTRIGGN